MDSSVISPKGFKMLFSMPGQSKCPWFFMTMETLYDKESFSFFFWLEIIKWQVFEFMRLMRACFLCHGNELALSEGWMLILQGAGKTGQ